jgi:hypothetical protein
MQPQHHTALMKALRWSSILILVILPAISGFGFLLVAISNYVYGLKVTEPLGELLLSLIVLSLGLTVLFARSQRPGAN